ncbi:MAG TPA: septal ring lytic transglycosylase RlpA family protein [Gemmatimonadales bacterium]|nr:septal ring lytic transglycosylase RlpA family protein [Gemmatimonadales bacterium]
MRRARALARNLAVLLALLAACAPATRPGPGPAPERGAGRVETGLASWYGPKFHGRRTASGERFDRHALVAAHPTLPFGTRVRVSRVETGKSVVVRIVDRGPAAGPRADGVVIDLSEAAAKHLGFRRDGRTRVRLEVLP